MFLFLFIINFRYYQKNEGNSTFYFSKAAQTKASEHVIGLYELGKCLIEESDRGARHRQGLFYLELASKKGSVDAKVTLGKNSLTYDVEHVFRKGITYLEEAAAEGSLEAGEVLGKLYLKGDTFIQKDIQKAAAYFYSVKDHPEAQYELALMHKDGLISEHDNLVSSIEWFTKAAHNGHLLSKKFLADLYFLGDIGVPKNEQQALFWLVSAAESGDSATALKINELGKFYKLIF